MSVNADDVAKARSLNAAFIYKGASPDEVRPHLRKRSQPEESRSAGSAKDCRARGGLSGDFFPTLAIPITSRFRTPAPGDSRAFSRLVEAYQGPVYNLCYRVLGNPHDAEEAAQEAFLRAYTHLGSYDPTRSLNLAPLHCASLLH